MSNDLVLNLSKQLPWLNSLFFIVIRLGTVLLFTPIQAIRQLPIPTRLLLVFILSLLMVNFIPNHPKLDYSTIVAGGLAEFSNGLILATSLYAAFAVFQIAGQIIDNEMGLNSLVIFNPGEHSQESVSSHLLSMLTVLLFFGLNGHLWLFPKLNLFLCHHPSGRFVLICRFYSCHETIWFDVRNCLYGSQPNSSHFITY